MEKILILGGTHFIGRNLVEKLLQKDKYDITLSNRGLTNIELFPNLQHIYLDRNKDPLNRLMEVDWDYIIDLSCYYPDSLEKICQLARPGLKRYIFISTCSVYDNEVNKSILRDERAAILSCSTEQRNNTDNSTYGNRKAACEQILRKSGIPHSILRPALVYGQYDSTDRFYYWIYQVKEHNPLLLPEEGNRIFSTTYVYDLVYSILKCLQEEDESTTYNIISLPKTSIRKIVEEAAKWLNKKPNLLSASTEFLTENEIDQWSEMPLWISGDHFTYQNKRSIESMIFEPSSFAESVRATIAYYEGIGWPIPKFGMPEKRRLQLIQKLN